MAIDVAAGPGVVVPGGLKISHLGKGAKGHFGWACTEMALIANMLGGDVTGLAAQGCVACAVANMGLVSAHRHQAWVTAQIDS